VFNYILIPSDGSQLSEEAVQRGIDLAKSVGARVTGFTAIPEYPRGGVHLLGISRFSQPGASAAALARSRESSAEVRRRLGENPGGAVRHRYESRTDPYLLISALLAAPKHMGASPSLWPLMESPVWKRF
jgi:nucleotide-binding universal stress UspA family protein